MTVHSTRVWHINPNDDDATARNYITASAGSDILCAFDLSKVVNPGESLSGVPVVTESTAALSWTGEALDEYNTRVECRCDLDGIDPGIYTNTVTVATTDNDTLVYSGKLRVV